MNMHQTSPKNITKISVKNLALTVPDDYVAIGEASDDTKEAADDTAEETADDTEEAAE